MFSKSSAVSAAGVSRRWLALGFVLVLLGVAGCGSSSSGTTSSSSEPAKSSETSRSSESSGSEAGKEETKNGIPQGEHAGDGDGDNKGGPSDGDGNI